MRYIAKLALAEELGATIVAGARQTSGTPAIQDSRTRRESIVGDSLPHLLLVRPDLRVRAHAAGEYRLN